MEKTIRIVVNDDTKQEQVDALANKIMELLKKMDITAVIFVETENGDK